MRDYDIKSPTLAEQGGKCIEWAWQEMPVLHELMQRFGDRKPLAGIRLSACLQITTETANLARTLKAAGPAHLKLAAMGAGIDTSTAEQQHYLSSWQKGAE